MEQQQHFDESGKPFTTQNLMLEPCRSVVESGEQLVTLTSQHVLSNQFDIFSRNSTVLRMLDTSECTAAAKSMQPFRSQPQAAISIYRFAGDTANGAVNGKFLPCLISRLGGDKIPKHGLLNSGRLEMLLVKTYAKSIRLEYLHDYISCSNGSHHFFPDWRGPATVPVIRPRREAATATRVLSLMEASFYC
ncbi:unnamed protein product [Phytophthora lilii]|uniref:Unnamed protein product n=1 Tax=Phytophthora lilii TaxID=2077276 RepID=A0A9W6TIN0_9STRA|nr:unnamed protein product [Phytophthora lilii]